MKLTVQQMPLKRSRRRDLASGGAAVLSPEGCTAGSFGGMLVCRARRRGKSRDEVIFPKRQVGYPLNEAQARGPGVTAETVPSPRRSLGVRFMHEQLDWRLLFDAPSR
jgi:hypothetical protein